MTQEEILRILMKGAEKQKDDLNDYTKGKRDGLVEAYSHAWTLVKKLTIPVVMQQSELLIAFQKYLLLPGVDNMKTDKHRAEAFIRKSNL